MVLPGKGNKGTDKGHGSAMKPGRSAPQPTKHAIMKPSQKKLTK